MNNQSSTQETSSLIGQILLALGKLTRQQLDNALILQKSLPEDDRKPLGQMLLEMDLITANDIIDAIKVQMKMRDKAEEV